MKPRALPRSIEDLRGLRAARWIRESTAGQVDRFGPDAQRDQQDRAIERYGLRVTMAMPARGLEPLTPREAEALEAYGNLWSYSAVARVMGVSEGTVRTHLANARSKLGVSRTAAAVVLHARNRHAD